MALPISWCTDEGDTQNMYKVAPFPKRFHLRSPGKINSKEHMKGCSRDVFCDVQKTTRQPRRVKQGDKHEDWWSGVPLLNCTGEQFQLVEKGSTG